MIKKYRKKPVVVEAHQLVNSFIGVIDALTFIGIISPSIEDAFGQAYIRELIGRFSSKYGIIIQTLEGDHLASWGDYIIKGTKGEFYPCKPDIFVGIYDEVTE